MPTSRSELVYIVWPEVVDEGRGKLLVKSTWSNWLASCMLGRRGKAIVFCQSRREVDELADFLGGDGQGVARYHSGMGEGDKMAELINFGTLDQVRLIVATIGLGVGLDWDRVNAVIFFGLPESMLTLDQGFGRAGRGNYRGIALAIPKQSNWWERTDRSEEQRDSWDEVQAWAAESHRCRRWWLTKSVYGEGFTCAMEGEHVMWCDTCWARAGRGRVPWVPSKICDAWTRDRWVERDEVDAPTFLAKVDLATIPRPPSSSSIVHDEGHVSLRMDKRDVEELPPTARSTNWRALFPDDEELVTVGSATEDHQPLARPALSHSPIPPYPILSAYSRLPAS